MQFRFTYTIDDVREAVRTALGAPTSRRGRMMRRVTGCIVFLVIVSAIFASFTGLAAVQPGAVERPELDLRIILIPALLPAVELILLVFWALFRQFRLRPAVSRDPNVQPGVSPPRKSTVPSRLAAGCVGAVPALALWWLFAPGPRIAARLDTGGVAQIVGGLIMIEVLLLWACLWMYGRFHVRSQWNARPSWRRDKVMTLDVKGLTIIDSHSRNEFAWAYFTRARESERLLVFHGEDGLMYLLPKRAVPEAELEHVRALVGNSVPSEFLVRPGGFAVLPRDPVPVQPIES